MKFISPLVCVCILISATISAQISEIDRLKFELQTASSENEKVTLLGDIGDYFIRTQIFHDSAFYYIEQALDVARTENLPMQEARALFDLGRVNLNINNIEKSIEYYKESQKVIESLKNPVMLSGVFNNIGGAYIELGNYQKALNYYNRSLQISIRLGDSESLAIDYMNIGEAEYKLGKLEISRDHFELAGKHLSDANWEPPTYYLFYARTLLALNEKIKAYEFAEKAFIISENSQDLKMISESAFLLSQIEKQNGDFKSALGYFEKHVAVNDKLKFAKENNELEKLKLNFEINKKNKEIAHIQMQNSYLNYLYFSIGLALVLLVILIMRQVKISRMTQSMHNVQKLLVSKGLEEQEQKSKKVRFNTFWATVQGDNEFKVID